MSGALTATVTLGALEVTVHELTVPQIRAELASADALAEDADLVDAWLIEGMPLWDLSVYCSLTREQIAEHNLAPSQIRQVVEKIRELNRDFFGMWARVKEFAAPQESGLQRSSGTSHT